MGARTGHARFDWERGIRGSTLPASARLVALTVATYTSPDGVTPAGRAPSLTDIAAATGLDRSTVRRHLNRLEVGGWVNRRRPTVDDARKKAARTAYELATPGGTVPLGLGAENTGPGGTVPPDLGAENTGPRGTVPLKSEHEHMHARAGAREADVVLAALPDRLAGKVTRSTLEDVCADLGPSWTPDALRRAAGEADWTSARGGGAVIAWLKDRSRRDPPAAREPSKATGNKTCSNGKVVAADGSCCHEHDAQQAGDAA
ncbi:IclR-like helix-turn-helix domain-containing protein [Haloactinopolyspora alba]|uniref:IclR-like helix-turn-helix domain-containing protein n=1 Tax=Haloactinopolyspora alba TaxID=648780 RepID=A0A2P8DZ59_9ACTN|nr:helix-turn-helix domain-containing protein [Haloactinopolyspora alba]PSL02504.1 IclR-like helix-turn-helix domain-containing protein [Haloactinopolyspora alba]